MEVFIIEKSVSSMSLELSEEKSVSSMSLELSEDKLLSSTISSLVGVSTVCSNELKSIEEVDNSNFSGVEVQGFGLFVETGSDTENGEIGTGGESIAVELEATDMWECKEDTSHSISLFKAIFKDGTAKS